MNISTCIEYVCINRWKNRGKIALAFTCISFHYSLVVVVGFVFSDSWSALECHCKHAIFVVLLVEMKKKTNCAHLILSISFFFSSVSFDFFPYRVCVVIQADKSSIEIESVFRFFFSPAARNADEFDTSTCDKRRKKRMNGKPLMRALRTFCFVHESTVCLMMMLYGRNTLNASHPQHQQTARTRKKMTNAKLANGRN